jgi:hypothetical protein
VVAVIVLVPAVAAGWAVFWALGLPAASGRRGLSVLGQLPVRIAAAAVVAVIVGGLLAWAFRPAQTLRRTARTWGTAARRRTTRIPLFGSLTAAVVIGFGLAASASWIAGGAVFQRAASAGAVDVVKASLPTIAGVVIAVALVVVYRRQKDTERAQFAQRFGAASAQLGHSDTAVRIAGVYAMAAAADESPVFSRRQQCIDVLCGYLRLPYDPDAGSNNLSEFVSTTTWSATPPAVNIEETRRQAVRQNDREVRDTIGRVLSQRLSGTADTSGPATTSISPACCSRTPGLPARGSAVGTCGLTGPCSAARTPRSRTWNSTPKSSRSTGPPLLAKDTSFDEARFAGEYVSFRRVGFSSGQTSFGSAAFKCLRASFDAPAEWKNVEFDWDNPPSGSQPAVPRCITPRPWPPSLVAKESGTSSRPAAPEKDDDLAG